MSVLDPIIQGESVRFDAKACAAAGARHHADYVHAEPFPHAVLDDFLPVPMLRRVLDEFPGRQKGKFADEYSNLKTGYQLDMIDSAFITNLMYAFNSAQFLSFMEELTGIKPLVPDPYYAGGGLHETARGGHLKIHADFNIHPSIPLVRRMNLILFLNEDWPEDYGGHLELWNTDMQSCAKRVTPLMGRAVVFNTDKESYHGHPDPLSAPEGRFRRSIALYYYTVPEGALPERHTTLWQSRPDSEDPAPKLGVRRLVRELCPPVLLRAIGRLRSG